MFNRIAFSTIIVVSLSGCFGGGSSDLEVKGNQVKEEVIIEITSEGKILNNDGIELFRKDFREMAKTQDNNPEVSYVVKVTRETPAEVVMQTMDVLFEFGTPLVSIETDGERIYIEPVAGGDATR